MWLILIPIIFFLTLAFVFQNATTDIKNQHYLLNCPSPINNGIATLGNPFVIGGVRLNFTIGASQNPTTDYNGTFFECSIINNSPAVTTAIKPYGKTLFAGFPQGWFAWVGDTVYTYLLKAQPALNMIWSYITAPAQVINLAFFTYINIAMLGMLGLGIVLLIRG